MGYGIHRFLCNVDPNIVCAICGGVLDDAVVTPCGHTYCTLCLETWLTSPNTCTCPECRAPLEPLDARPVLALRNLIGAMTVECENSDRGCKIVTKLENMSQHVESCGYVATQCGACGHEMHRYELPTHRADCARRRCACDEEPAAGNEEKVSEMLLRVASLEMELKRVRRELELEHLKCKRLQRELKRATDCLDEHRAAQRCQHAGQPSYFDADYRYGSTPQSVAILSNLISRFLANKPAYIDAHRIFDCVQRCYEKYGHGGDQYERDVHMLVAVADASNWFNDNQRLSFQCWLQSVARYRQISRSHHALYQ